MSFRVACPRRSGKYAWATSKPPLPTLPVRNIIAPMPLPLSGLLVVSLEQAVAAPMCTCRLADAGARVIKVERPEGDFARYYDKLAVPRARSAPSPLVGEGWGWGWGGDAPTLPHAPTATP